MFGEQRAWYILASVQRGRGTAQETSSWTHRGAGGGVAYRQDGGEPGGSHNSTGGLRTYD